MLGSVLSRGINGQAPFFETLGASVLLVVLHRLLAAIACRSPAVSRLVKGGAVVLVKGRPGPEGRVALADISLDDLNENLRLNCHRADCRRGGSPSGAQRPDQRGEAGRRE